MKKILIPTAIITALAIALIAFSAFANSANTPTYTTALELLSEKGIAEGFEDGELHPERTLTRGQFAKLLVSAFPDVPETKMIIQFTDMTEEHWAYESVQKAANAGWIDGYPDGTFRPDENITYEQAATIISRVLDLWSLNYSYPDGYVSMAVEYSLTDGINALIGEEINREQAAQFIINALEYNELNDYEDNFYTWSYITGSSSGGSGGGSAPAMLMTDSISEDIDGYAESYKGYTENEVYIPYDINSEEYAASEENIFKNPITSPLSTFSIDADTASYSNLRRFILNGEKIPVGAVRSEELINYFDYTKAETEEGKPFGVNYTVAECPWNTEHDLAMITVSGEELVEKAPSNIVFLIDVSGSMDDYNKLPLVKKSLSMLLDKLDENDKVSIVTYASHTGVALEPTPATEKEKILDVINNLMAGGSTAGASGINLAYEQAEKFKCDGNNRIILCTDGDFNVGISSSADLEALITEKRESGIFLSVLGFGMGNYKDSRMETLADKGNGNYYYIDNLREAKKVLVDEMPKTIYTIAKDVKIQAEFNPEKVAQYRLIGYENRLLNNEDFENDKKDAGELGAGATVTVLYEIIPQTGEVTNPLKYQTTESTGSDELMTVKIRYKHPDGDESILSEYPVFGEKTAPTDDFNFAAAVAELGMILNNSEFVGNATYDSVIDLARNSLGDDPYGIRSEFVQLVDLLRYSHK